MNWAIGLRWAGSWVRLHTGVLKWMAVGGRMWSPNAQICSRWGWRCVVTEEPGVGYVLSYELLAHWSQSVHRVLLPSQELRNGIAEGSSAPVNSSSPAPAPGWGAVRRQRERWPRRPDAELALDPAAPGPRWSLRLHFSGSLMILGWENLHSPETEKSLGDRVS